MRSKEVARGVIRLPIRDLRVEIDGLNVGLEARRDHLNTLMPTLHDRRWAMPWPAAAKALLHDPEAAIDRHE